MLSPSSQHQRIQGVLSPFFLTMSYGENSLKFLFSLCIAQLSQFISSIFFIVIKKLKIKTTVYHLTLKLTSCISFDFKVQFINFLKLHGFVYFFASVTLEFNLLQPQTIVFKMQFPLRFFYA